ncbi:hypothetical protein SPI_06936 [Niveomyces insectorum RCEF 264]|uniref:RNA-binding protein n=1 Tax=Niveomyces insectorum RCEF 264 TaxID=1081102 RepID=A0A167QX25_9HYPO|nr:hypothetical protein SPI_06936 [Niveomyces insectorum RCEF 264]
MASFIDGSVTADRGYTDSFARNSVDDETIHMAGQQTNQLDGTLPTHDADSIVARRQGTDGEDGGARLGSPFSQSSTTQFPHDARAKQRTQSGGSGSDYGHAAYDHGDGFGARMASHPRAAQVRSHDLSYADSDLYDGDVSHAAHSLGPGRAQSPSSGLGHAQGYGCTPAANAADGPGTARPVFERSCMRTIELGGLSESATHADVAAVVRGGPVLDIYIRTRDRAAMVSFLREADARNFFTHVRKHPLYIKSKRVDVRWADRQFLLPGHVSNKVAVGATRNLLIRRCDPRITEQTVRDDLDHIHNIVVLSVKFARGNCYIDTNSVHNALFARTCMMSRALYRSSRIEWAPDACAQPIEPVTILKPKKKPITAKKPPVFVAVNRFQLLNLDEVEDDDTDGSGDDENGEDEVDDGIGSGLDERGGAVPAVFQPTRRAVGVVA